MKTSQTEERQLAFRRYVDLASVFCLCAWLAYNLFETVQRIASYYVPIPVEDYWRVVQNLHDYQSLHLAVFWKQHNEHRIVFPELVFAVDMLLAHGRMILPLACSFLCYALTWAALSLTVAKDAQVPRYGRIRAILLAGIVTFWQGSAPALAQPFLLQWPLTQSMAVLSLLFLRKTAGTKRLSYLVAAIGAAIVATYSSANGLMLWPLLTGVAFALRLSKKRLIVLGISAAAFTGIYFVHYQVSESLQARALILHPAHLLGFVATYLSMPLGIIWPPHLGLTIGMLNLALVSFLFSKAWRSRLFETTPAVVLFGYYLFTLLTIALTAAGRMDLEDVAFAGARATRYLTMPFLNWAVVILLLCWMSSRLRWRILNTKALTVAISLLLLVSAPILQNHREGYARYFADFQLDALGLDNGLTDSGMVEDVSLDPEFEEGVYRNLFTLKQNHLAIFSRHHENWLGENLMQLGTVRTGRIRGGITEIYPVEHGLEMVGWVKSDNASDPFPRIFLANERGQVVGWGRRPDAGFPAAWHFLKTPASEAWIAFANLAIPSQSVSAFAAARRGLAPIEGAVTVPTLVPIASTEGGSPVKNITWRMDGSWSPNGISLQPDFGWQPSTVTYTSWQEHDRNAGRIVGEFPTPQGACVILPVLHGPSTVGLSAQLVDADSGNVLADLPFRDSVHLWTLWQIKLSSRVRRLGFAATDNGRDQGQWLAVSAPLECRM